MTRALPPRTRAGAIAVLSTLSALSGCNHRAAEPKMAEDMSMADASRAFQLNPEYILQLTLESPNPTERAAHLKAFEKRLRMQLRSASNIRLSSLSDDRACTVTTTLAHTNNPRELTLYARWVFPDIAASDDSTVQFVIEFATLPVTLNTDDKPVGETALDVYAAITAAAKLMAVAGEIKFEGSAP